MFSKTSVNLASVGLVSLSMLIGCSFPQDPSLLNQTSLTPDQMWKPAGIKPIPPIESQSESESQNVDAFKDASDLNLANILDYALRFNPLTKRTWSLARIDAFEVGYRKNPYYPQAEFTDSLAYQDTRLTRTSLKQLAEDLAENPDDESPRILVLPGYTKSLTHDLIVSYLLLDFGRTSHDVEAARMALYASDWIHNRGIQEVMINVLNAYYLFLGTTALLEAKEADLKNVTASYEAAKQLYEAGITTKLDSLQAEIDVLTTKTEIIDLEGQQNVVLGQLATAIGLPANTKFPSDLIAKLPIEIPFDEVVSNLDQLIATAKDQRPDLSAAYATYEQSKEELGVAIAEGKPTLSISGDFTKNSFFNISATNYTQYTGVLAFNVPIFTGFALTYQLKKAQEKVRLNAANIAITEQSVMLEVLTSYYNFKTSSYTIKLDEETLKVALEAYNLAFARYKDGISTILDLLLAQNNLSQARANLVRDRTRWAITLANISFNTGLLVPFKNNPDYHPIFIEKDKDTDKQTVD